MRTVRTRTAIAATAALLTGLSLTACQSDDTAKAADPAGSGKATATTSETPAATPSSGTGGSSASATPDTDGGKSSGSGSGTGGSGKEPGKGTSGGGSGDDSAAALATCTSANTKVVASKVSRPINHLLLTATNTGSRPCAAYGAPLLQFDDEQSPTQFIEDSHPQAVVMLDPGQSAYASVLLQGEDISGGRTAKVLRVSFAPRNGSGSVGSPVKLTLPADTFKTDDAAVSYWQSDMSDALVY
ncbi:DUF4232 domain-containing protein [Streptomyces sp. FIT100]|uniref:DUF4232 domain-containing protein n=1 Tax=Streptomyces sp. FIT100 TaxID=2837956 RepID=UPI0021C71575|nr:DUF4232 domain-containing protein [Streptomyces sp. FIT100]UUN28452.1 DUF4232 domain-containing protein [Streptomyces sp. FIT100]